MTAEKALELLHNKQDRIPSVMSKWFLPVSSAVLTFGGICYVKFFTKRPLFSGIQNYFIYPIIAGFAGQLLENVRTDYYAERDAVFRHYIQLHPEDFVMPERKKISDMFEPWTPIR